MTDYPSTSSPGNGDEGSFINAGTTRDDILLMMRRNGISDLEGFVKANLDRVVQDDDDNAPDDSTHALIHSHFICWRESTHM